MNPSVSNQPALHETAADQHAPLHLALSLSEEILAVIESENWDLVNELDQKRRIIIDQYFKSSAPFDEQLTRKLKLKNDEIVSRLISHQQKIRTQQFQLKQAAKVSRAYQANTPAAVRNTTTMD